MPERIAVAFDEATVCAVTPAQWEAMGGKPRQYAVDVQCPRGQTYVMAREDVVAETKKRGYSLILEGIP